MIKYYFDYKESKHLKEAQLKELAKEMSLSLKELKVEAQEQIKAIERAMEKNYISNKDIKDFEKDSLRRQHYYNRKGIAFR
jgi:hypothetical protein